MCDFMECYVWDHFLAMHSDFVISQLVAWQPHSDEKTRKLVHLGKK